MREYNILDTAPEHQYDYVAELIREECRMTWSCITLVDRERNWFKARKGFHETELPRYTSFCSVCMHLNDPLIVENALHDPRFRQNPLVTGVPLLRFYAGFPLVSSEGYPLGAICIVDVEPRTLFPSQLQLLLRARDWVQAKLELRRVDRALAATDPADSPAYKRSQQLQTFAQLRVEEAWSLIETRRRPPRVAPRIPAPPRSLPWESMSLSPSQR